ncbi:hypothetical protein H0264_19570 [Nocardia huaxiensis]|uniref:Peptide chain release factor 1 n=1 Tax=Nocardia huaxiensis TaxID=2755382 RepID=A0A7D6VE66_9NOCA|nr:hypothetical protein [Nocardia huaxiensis]QLY27670.1 hypothetical protein H0264_19570 [Nocardia huaxiensis]
MIDRTGPFASVYFDSSHDTEDADRQFELNQRTIREKLSAAGASADVIGAIGIAVAAGPPAAGRSGRALIADCRTVLVDEQLPAPPPRELVRVSPLPCILPLLEQRAPRVPHVVALLHPAGARLYAMDRHGDPMTWSVDPVNPLRGSRGQRQTRRHARDRMHRRIDEVADQMCRLADRVAAVLLILIGDAPARAALHNALDARYTGDGTADSPENVRRIVEIDGADREALRDLVRKTVAEAAEAHCRLILNRYRAERERPWGATASGLAETTAALRDRFVAQLLIDGSALDEHQVLVGDRHTEIATTAKELTGHPEIRRADEALPAAALAGNSEIVPIGGRMLLPDGVGALLRRV